MSSTLLAIRSARIAASPALAAARGINTVRPGRRVGECLIAEIGNQHLERSVAPPGEVLEIREECRRELVLLSFAGTSRLLRKEEIVGEQSIPCYSVRSLERRVVANHEDA